ncbi:adhesion G-protein coupled receptor G7-like [Branchiostoma floridae x Branchiostoma japonicum]
MSTGNKLVAILFLLHAMRDPGVTDGVDGQSTTTPGTSTATPGTSSYGRSKKIIFPYPRSTSNYAELNATLSEELSSFTLCVHMRTNDTAGSLVSYATGRSANEIFFEGWRGKVVDHCQSDPCINGTCSSGPDNFTCTCDDGYGGETCQISVALVVVSADLTLAGEVFTDDLNDRSHPRFQMLARAIESETSLAFAAVPSFRKATVTRFRMGSVIATVDMKFQSTGQAPGSDEVVMTGILQQHISDNGGRLGNLTVSQVDAVISPVYCKEEYVQTEAGLVSFPRADGDSFSYSAERCNSSVENEKPLATRFCRITTGRTAVWDPPVLLTCDTDLRNLSQIVVTNETALSVAAEVQVITIQAETLSSDDVASISTILQEIVNVSATEQIGDSLLTTVDNLINVNVTVLQQSQQERRGPTRVVQALEAFADTVTLTTEKYTAVRPGVALQAADISPEDLDRGQGFAFFLSGDDSNSLKEGNVRSFTTKDGTGFVRTADISISIPPNISSTIQINNTSEVRLSYTLYNSSSLFVQTSQGAAGPSQDAVGTRVIGGRIAGRRVKNLPEPVIITFAPLQTFLSEDVRRVRCVFWDFEAEAGQGAWSTEGCESTGEENGLYTCACNHLTNFAAIFDVLGAGFGVHERPLEVITIVGCVVSIVCLVLTLLSFIVTRNYKRRASTGHARNQRLVLINLCVALLAILVIFLAGINQTASPIGCTVVAALLHYFLLAALVWMAVEAVNIYLAVVVVFDHHVSENFVIRAAAVAWGFPLVATVLTVGPSGLYQYRMENNCWLAQTPLIYAFLLPAGLILLFNLLVFVIVMRKLVRDEKELKQLRGAKVQEADRYWITRQIRRAFSIMALFGLTWLFGFFVITDARAVFAYLFCLFNTLQGLFIFIFHCVMREDMKKWWRKLRDTMAVPCSYSGGKKRGLYDVSGRRTSFSSTSVQTSQTTLVRLSSFSYNSKPDVGPL